MQVLFTKTEVTPRRVINRQWNSDTRSMDITWSDEVKNTTTTTFETQEMFTSAYHIDILSLGKIVDDENAGLVTIIDVGEVIPNRIYICTINGEESFFDSSLRTRYASEDVIWSPRMERHILKRYALYINDDIDDPVSQHWVRASDDWHRLYDSYEAYPSEQLTYCEDIGAYYWDDEVHWSERNDCYYYDEDNCQPEREVGCINEYSTTEDWTETLGPSDYDGFYIGFEIEKYGAMINGRYCDSLGDYVGEFDLFRGFETDSSILNEDDQQLGFEAITHKIPLSLSFREQFHQLTHEAAEPINGGFNHTCGGHIGFSKWGETAAETHKTVMPYMYLFFGIWPERLKNNYCNSNLRMLHPTPRGSNGYTAIRVRGNYCELRIPPGVENVADLRWRYDLFLALMTYAYDNKDKHYNIAAFVKHMVPVMKQQMDNKAISKAFEIYHGFYNWFLGKGVSDTIIPYAVRELSYDDAPDHPALMLSLLQRGMQRRNLHRGMEDGRYVVISVGPRRYRVYRRGDTLVCNQFGVVAIIHGIQRDSHRWGRTQYLNTVA